MFTVKLADLTIGVQNRYDYIEMMCDGYKIANTAPDFFVSATDAEIAAEQTADYGMGYLESLAIYRKIAEKILDYDGFLMHGVLLRCDGRGILLCAKSGVGKSTHAALWKQMFGNRCDIINGDKPLVRFLANGIFAYGTPWAGKEGMHQNAAVFLHDICFLERAEENSAQRLTTNLLKPLLGQIYFPKENNAGIVRTLDLADQLARNTRQWNIRCNMQLSAARVVHDALWE